MKEYRIISGEAQEFQEKLTKAYQEGYNLAGPVSVSITTVLFIFIKALYCVTMVKE